MKSDSSPPANKRVRRSPEQPAPPNTVPLQQMGGLFPQQTIRATGFGPQMGATPITQGTQQGANPQVCAFRVFFFFFFHLLTLTNF